jgi:hypothetical protein
MVFSSFTRSMKGKRTMRRKILMLAAPMALLLAALSVPASAISNCSCAYCGNASNPDVVCRLPGGGSTNCVTYYSANCP